MHSIACVWRQAAAATAAAERSRDEQAAVAMSAKAAAADLDRTAAAHARELAASNAAHNRATATATLLLRFAAPTYAAVTALTEQKALLTTQLRRSHRREAEIVAVVVGALRSHAPSLTMSAADAAALATLGGGGVGVLGGRLRGVRRFRAAVVAVVAAHRLSSSCVDGGAGMSSFVSTLLW